MRLGLTSIAGEKRPVAQVDGGLVALKAPAGATLLDLIAGGEALSIDSGAEPFEDVRLLAPLRPPKIVAIGLNYLDHIRETKLEAPTRPLVFTKFTTSLIGDGDEIVIDRELTARVDWEVELGVVIGRRMSRVGERDALDYVFGYTAANDVSARDLQFADGQWVRAKSLDTFCPLGPVVVTADEIPDPQQLSLSTRVNGETVQSSSTSEMIFGVAELLSFCSHSFALEPGDVVLTGTPWGCGEFMSPVRSLQAGDVVEVEVERIGMLRNQVVELGR
ncbi:MAG TPA: fumarylacetoacetate hydrolase family protein [Solirubrobacteraceae bacterium]|jgi:5-carboxymethyl-2-hydroxymuconate isomerase|nr:fumarylacetoacetate hydrolase family protein [Solirubrobacteraceae bacterium]